MFNTMKGTFKELVFAFLFLVAAYDVAAQNSDLLSVKAFADSIRSNKEIVLIDLRTPKELEGGVIHGATFIDYFDKSFEKRMNDLDPSKTYYLYCASNGRSGETVEFLKSKGFKHVYHLSGGFDAWKSAGMPIEAFKAR